MEPLDHQQGDQGCPNLNEKSVFALSDEGFHLQILFQRLEEEFDLPPVLVNRAYRARSELEMIREKNDLLVVLLRVLYNDPPKLPGVFPRSRSRQVYDLVGDNVSSLRRHTDFVHGIDGIVLHPRDEEYSPLRPGTKLRKIDIPPVDCHDGARREEKLLQNAAVVGFRIRYGDEGGHVVVVIEKHVNFDAALGSPEVRPRKERQAEADRRRVEGHQLVLEAELALPAPERRYGAEMIGQLPEQILEEFRRAMIVCVGESRSLGRILDPEMYEFPVAAGQTIDYLP